MLNLALRHLLPEHHSMPIVTTRISGKADMLGESPVWDADNGRLFWVDGFSRLVRCTAPGSETVREWSTPSMVGSIGLAQGNSLIAGFADGIYLIDLDSGASRPMFRPEPVDPAVRFNDGKVDRFGNFLCGSMGVHADPLGRLYRVQPDGRTTAHASGIRISNALCFSPDGRTMYFADSFDRALRVYDYDPADGPAAEPRALIDTSPTGSGPDGATVDVEGGIWVALIQAGKIGRYTPEGALVRLIDAPTDLPSCLAFGGPDMATLFVTSIKDSGSGRAVSKHPDGGCVFAIDGLGIGGIAETRFGAAY